MKRKKTETKQQKQVKTKQATPVVNQTETTDQVSLSGTVYGDSFHIQANCLGDLRLQVAQRQGLAAQIGRVQGNRHLQSVVSLPVQRRLTAAERAEDLRSPQLAGDPRLEAAFDDSPPMEWGERGEAVKKVQQALMDDGFDMPISTRRTGSPDGIFGRETFRTVKQFQTRHGVRIDGIVEIYVRPAPPAHAAPYTWRDLTLKAKIDGGDRAPDIVTYVQGLPPSDQAIAIADLQQGRIDYVERRRSAGAITKMDVVLQSLYRETARADTRASLLAGTRPLTPAERARIPSALVPPRSPATPFRSTIPAGTYETRIRDYLTRSIRDLYDELVVGRGPAEHADPANLYSMSRFEEIGNAAKAEVDAVFGSYRTGPRFRASVNLFDQWRAEQRALAAMSPAQRREKARDLVSYLLQSDQEVFDINRDHGAIPSRRTLSPGETESEFTILERIREDFTRDPADVRKLNEIDRGWGATAVPGQVNIQRWRGASALEDRRNFWDAFQTMIHEYCHTLIHPRYEAHAASYQGGTDAEEYDTLIEGVDSALTEIVWTNVEPRASSPALRAAVEGAAYASLPFDPAAVPDIKDQRYASYAQAMRLIDIVGIRNLYAAYFLGRTDLIAP
jgi:peptidoglycan hydrolase-like protein with peptidoglycan-binding domain